MRVIGVYREARFSPGKVDVDAAILDAVLAELARRGWRVATVDGAELEPHSPAPPAADLILAMCQSQAALTWLDRAQRAGAVVINPAAAIRACYRDRMGAILQAAGVPTPPGRLVETGLNPELAATALADFDLARGLFVKRGDMHALVADDVTRVDTLSALLQQLRRLADRAVTRAYLQAAVAGKVVKFYGVSPGYFQIAGRSEELDFNTTRALAQAAQRGATALGLEVWGGDAVVDANGFQLIDFNDWPSFAAVRVSAALAIADRALNRVELRRGASGAD